MPSVLPIAGIGASLSNAGSDLDEVAAQLDELGALGADSAEFYASSLGIVVAGRPIPARAARLRAICSARPLAYSIHAPIPINPMDRAQPELHRRAMNGSVALAAEIGADVVVIHAGRATPEQWAGDADALLAFERDELRGYAEMARAAGVSIAVENISPNPAVIAGRETSYSLDPSALARQLALLDEPGIVGCLDVSHANQGAGLQGHDLVAGCAAMGPVTRHLHVSDTTGQPSPSWLASQADMSYFGVGDMHAPLGTAGIDYAAVAAALRPLPGTRAILELLPVSRPMLGDSLARLRVFADRVNALCEAA